MEDMMILPHKWRQDDDPENDSWMKKELEIIIDILEEAEEAQRMRKGESAWNAQVHYPILKLAFPQFLSLRPETIASAQNLEEFRPRSNNPSSSASSSDASSCSSLIGGDLEHEQNPNYHSSYMTQCSPVRDWPMDSILTGRSVRCVSAGSRTR
ncbi:hypothetical protein DER46DRAFT_689387 [Fusarium sp. MPI-SDFR-AT-0072]|nr:hypothetical protein DER46DRAFT_689387 [Fusarium sp. MPI-SDFR-AT-0072]